MEPLAQIRAFAPACEQEEKDKALILQMAALWPDTIFLRENEIAHFTASGFVLSEDGQKALMVFHNIYNSWSWTGGHADGETDLLSVALREAVEESAVQNLRALSKEVVSLDILPVKGHLKRGRYVAPHLHLSVSYALAAPEGALRSAPEENSGAAFLKIKDLPRLCTEQEMLPLYEKIIARARKLL